MTKIKISKRSARKEQFSSTLLRLLLAALAVILAACSGAGNPVKTPAPTLAAEIVLYNWYDYMPQTVLDAFTKEFGVKVRVEGYESEEQAVENIRAGKVYDVVVLTPGMITALVNEGKLAEINYHNVPNFRNVSANFRDLSFDPDNQHSIPFHWGSTGLLVRRDLVDKPVKHWSDLWDPAFAGRVGIWPIPRAVIPITLKSLGYSVNSEDPAQLEDVLKRLVELRKNSFLVSNENASIVPALASGEAVIGYGWAYDAMVARQQNLPIDYILPEEGGLLWSDNFVIPANSPHHYTVEVFLNFLLRPEISGQIINESYYPMANDAAERYVQPDILKDPFVYPTTEEIKKAEITLALSPEGMKRYGKIWEQFLAAGPAE